MTYAKLGSISFTGSDANRTDARVVASTRRTLLLLVFASACGFPRPPNVGDDAPVDSSPSGVTVHVSPSGNDVNDGVIQPVKTLKRAIGIASNNATITTIA